MITIYFFNGNNQDIQHHYAQKEYRNDIIVKIGDLFYEVYFFTQSSLTYEFTRDGFFSFPGLIILDDISNEKIITSIKYLANLGYFDSFKGAAELSPNRRFLEKWYLNDMGDFSIDTLDTLDIY